jgi:hypothetical protein
MSDVQVEPTAVVETRLAHNVHRRATALLAASAGPSAPVPALVELRGFLVGTLHHHHESEDADLWLLLTASAPELAGDLAALSKEHAGLEAALTTLSAVVIDDDRDRRALRDAAIAVRDLVHTHLEHEEPILLPALRTHVSDEMWAAFSERVVATAPADGIHLMFGFFDQVGTPAEVDLVVDTLPDPVRQLVPEMREQANATFAALGQKRDA